MSSDNHDQTDDPSARCALDKIRGFALAGRILVSRHATLRMAERCATFTDLREALITATACQAEHGERWKVTGGVDGDGEALTLVVVVETNVVVVTLF